MSNKHDGKRTGRCVTSEVVRPAGGVHLETFVHWKLVKRGVKKEVIMPPNAPGEFQSELSREQDGKAATNDAPLMRALGLAFHWQRLLDEQRVPTVAAIAEAEGMDITQVRRVLRLTLLAPALVARLTAAPDAKLAKVIGGRWPVSWIEQCSGSSI